MSAEKMPMPAKRSPKANDAFVTFVKLIITCLTGNPYFLNTDPTVASLSSQVDALALANAKAKGRGPGLVADRDAKRKHIEEDLDKLVLFVAAAVKVQAP